LSTENESSSQEVTREGNNSRPEQNKLCVCPKCGALLSHRMDIPCYKLSCSKCGSKMLSM